MPAGRPTELTPEFQQTFCEVLRQCWYVETACYVVGIHPSTVRNWMRWGRKWNGIDEAHRKHAEFFAAVKGAMAEAEFDAAKLIHQHGREGAWQAIAWLMERSRPGRWGNIRSELARIAKQQAETDAKLESIPLRQNGPPPTGTSGPPNGQRNGHG